MTTTRRQKPPRLLGRKTKYLWKNFGCLFCSRLTSGGVFPQTLYFCPTQNSLYPQEKNKGGFPRHPPFPPPSPKPPTPSYTPPQHWSPWMGEGGGQGGGSVRGAFPSSPPLVFSCSLICNRYPRYCVSMIRSSKFRSLHVFSSSKA